MGGGSKKWKLIQKEAFGVIVAGESSSTTGVVKRGANGRYMFYYHNPSEKKHFQTSSVHKENMLKLYEQFQLSDKTKESYNKIREKITGKQQPKLNGRDGEKLPKYLLYDKSTDNYRINYKNNYFGCFKSFEKAVYIRNYLNYRNYPMELSPQELCNKRRVRGDEYYQMMRIIISTDREYLKFNKE